MKRFEGKVALITGGSTGIGRVTAQRLAQEGALVVIGARRKDLGEVVAEEIRADGGEALFVPADVTLEPDVARLVETAITTYGRLDLAFNNAGLSYPVGPVQNLDGATWQRFLDVNLTGVFLSLKHQIPALLTAGGGAVLNNASILGTVGAPGMAPYVAAKHAVIGLTRSVALEVADKGIRVNALVTGKTDTGMADPFRTFYAANPSALGPTGRLARPEEIASFAAYLLSDEAGYITGAALAIDGGTTAR